MQDLQITDRLFFTPKVIFDTLTSDRRVNIATCAYPETASYIKSVKLVHGGSGKQ